MPEVASTAPAVALLFEDAALGARLRQALLDRGAQIVLEDSAAHATPAAVADSGAEVIVISLESAAEDAIEILYGALDGSRQRVVFNDAEASRRLSGWDQARWARHLAAKILGSADVDPPRPAGARVVPAPMTAAVDPQRTVTPTSVPLVETEQAPVDAEVAGQQATSVLAIPQAQPVENVAEVPVAQVHASGASESIGDAEIDALFELLPATIDPAGAINASVAPLVDPTALDDEIAALLAGSPLLDAADAGLQAPVPTPTPVEDIDAWLARVSAEQEQGPLTVPVSDTVPVAQVNVRGFSLEPLDEIPSVSVPVTTLAPASLPDAPDWGLLGFDLPDGFDSLPSAPDAVPVTAAEFGIETVSAADYLAPAPMGADGVAPFEVDFGGLELIPIEEAVAPHVEAKAHELNSTGQRFALRRVVVLGASIGGPEALHEFLAALPADLPAALVVAQHIDAAFNGSLTQQLGKAGTLPVRLAEAGASLRHGEVMVVPSGKRLRIDRSGRVQLEPLPTGSPYDPSIDDTFTAVAETFGPDVLALILSGMASDAVAGAHVVAARGGRVWGQEPSSCVVSSMVDAAGSAGLIGYFATPRDLAARLASELGRGQA